MEKQTPRIGTGLAGPGRPKGVPNKINGELKEMILTALSDLGGPEYLKTAAITHPQAFLSLLGRVLPMQVAGDPNNPIQAVARIELVALK